MADYVHGWKVSYATYSQTAPTTWKELKDCVRNVPNLFGEPDNIDCSTVDNNTPRSIPGPPSAESYAFTILPTANFLTAHKEMVTDQNDDAKGSFWLRVDFATSNRRVQFQAKTANFLPTSDGSFGDLEEIEVPFYAQSDMEDISPIPTT